MGNSCPDCTEKHCRSIVSGHVEINVKKVYSLHSLAYYLNGSKYICSAHGTTSVQYICSSPMTLSACGYRYYSLLLRKSPSISHGYIQSFKTDRITKIHEPPNREDQSVPPPKGWEDLQVIKAGFVITQQSEMFGRFLRTLYNSLHCFAYYLNDPEYMVTHGTIPVPIYR